MRSLILGLLVVLLGAPTLAGAEPDPIEMQRQLAELEWPAGAFLMGAALLPLFFGWRLVVLAFMIGTGIGLGLVAMVVAGRFIGETPGYIAGGVALVVGLFLGRTLHRLSRALSVAALLALLAALPGLASDSMLVTLGVSAAAAVLGFILGWVFARQVEAFATALAGGQFFAAGTYVVARSQLEHQPALIASLIAGGLLFIAGLRFQLRDLHSNSEAQRVSGGDKRDRKASSPRKGTASEPG
ncbi:MAG: hypothetical protein ACOCZK_06265 [Planctomycetota bacterium]